MKKIIAILLACILSLTLFTGCGEKESDEAAAGEKNLQAASSEDRPRVPPESIVGAELQSSDGEQKRPSKDGEKSGKNSDGEKAKDGEQQSKDAGKTDEASKGESAVTLSGEKKDGKNGESSEKSGKSEKTDGEKTEKKTDGDKQASGEKTEEGGEKKSKKGGKRSKNGKNGKRSKNGKNGKWGKRKKKTEDQAANDAAPETASEAPAERDAEDAPQDRSAMQMPAMQPSTDEPVALLLAGEAEPERTYNAVNLEGAWEPRNEVGPRAEISGNRLIRLWNGAPVLATNFTVKQNGDSVELVLADKELRYAPGEEPYATVVSCVYEDGELTFTDDFPVTGESSAVLYPTRNSRYGNVTDVSYETLPQLAGRWEQEGGDAVLEFSGNSMSFGYGNHVDGTVNVLVVRANRERSRDAEREENTEERTENRQEPAAEETAAPERSGETEGEASGENAAEGRGTGRRGNRTGRRSGNRQRNRDASGNSTRSSNRSANRTRTRQGGRGGEIRIVNIDPGVKTVGTFNSLTFRNDTIVGTVGVADGEAVQVTFKRVPMAPGGSTDYSNYNAVTTISSTEITDFSCSISLLSVYLPDETLLTSPRYQLTAQKNGDAVACRRVSFAGDESFTPDAAFMEKLQAIIAQYNLAQFNGHDVVTHGLPDDFGATLSVTYSSGEKIYAADNQSMYLPVEAVRALVQLFYSAS